MILIISKTELLVVVNFVSSLSLTTELQHFFFLDVSSFLSNKFV